MPRSPVPTGSATFLGSFAEQLPDTRLPEIAFAGRSNVGKSSAINALLHSNKAARVSRTPGRTQRINLFQIGTTLCFADLPGYGYAKVPPDLQAEWGEFIEHYLATREQLRLVVSLVDANLPPQPIDIQLLGGLQLLSRPVLVVATKFDRISKSHRKPTLMKLAAGLGVEQVLPLSSTRREGVSEIWSRIQAACRGPRV